MDELLKRLNRYTRQCLTERTDPDFADAVQRAICVIEEMRFDRELSDDIEKSLKENLKDCRNELCLKCGEYKTRHLGSCDGCRWKE